MVTIGIDPHKRSLTAAALDPHSRLLGQLRVPASSLAATHLLAWAAAWPQRRWAVEGASGLGRGIAQLLVAAGEPVLDVPAKLAARARLLGSSSARKSDLADACSVAAAALHHRQLRPVVLEDQTMVLRLLSDRRDDLVAEPTPTLSRLHVLLADLQPGGANRELTATRAAALLRQIHHHGGRRRGQADRSPVAGRRAPPGPAGQDGQPGIRQAVREHGTTASSPRPRPLRRPAGASNDTCPTWSTATWSPITATVPGAVDTQRRYRVTLVSPGRDGGRYDAWLSAALGDTQRKSQPATTTGPWSANLTTTPSLTPSPA